MKIEPKGDKILVKRLDKETVSEGGILIPDIAQEKQARGEVIAVGEGITTKSGKLIPLSVNKGDIVCFPEFAGSDVEIDHEEFIIVAEGEILGKLVA